MSILTDLRGILIAHGIDSEEYSDEVLNNFILEAKLLVNEPFMFDTQFEDYEPDFCDDTYMTENYPVVTDSVTITVGDETITPDKVTSEGIIYLPRTIDGKFTITYTVGLGEDDINEFLLPITLYIIEEKQGKNIASIQEGDVNISYDTANGYNTQMFNLVNALKNKYAGRVVFI